MINDLFKLISFSQKFANIIRSVKVNSRESYESNAEHSYQVGLVSWYIAEHYNLKANIGKIIQYALVHDLVEVYAGDTDPHFHSEEFKNSKKEREKESLTQIKKEFSNFPSLYKTIESYEKQADIESRIVYIVDKILPVINTHISNDDYYIKNKVSFKKWKEWLEGKIENANAKKILNENFFNDLISFFEAHKELFKN